MVEQHIAVSLAEALRCERSGFVVEPVWGQVAMFGDLLNCVTQRLVESENAVDVVRGLTQAVPSQQRPSHDQ